jgi:serpin B
MVVILPNEKNGLGKLEKDLSKIQFSKAFKFDEPTTYRVELPKFKIEAKFDLIEKLEKLGIKDLFNGKKADLSGFTGSKGLYASAMIQKAFIEVNEEGSEAAAATGMIVSSRSLSEPASFICDHPFLFFIRDSKTGLVLFMGRVLDPTK